MMVKLSWTAANLRWRSALLFLVGVSALLLSACTPRQPYVPESSQIPFGQGRLWKVEGDGIETSYLFATLDFFDERIHELPPEAETAFGKAEVLALEQIEDPYILRDLYKEENLEMSGDRTLHDLIGARTYGTLSWHMKRNLRKPNDKIKPWVLWAYLGGEHFGFFDYDYEVDTRSDKSQADWLEDRAVTDGKKPIALQTEQEVFDIYDKMPLEHQAAMLQERADRLGEMSPGPQMMQFYLDGDLARLKALWLEYLSWLPPATAEVLDARRITDRNLVMVERLLPLMKEQPVFTAVDHLHLTGEKGMLRLLEQRGFSVVSLR
ncbi:TraB/GumN family protein [Pelagibius sp.]|uniref:TraB/GumN family protein n=1 Tax=Pelagibius sp. TaxID=1931238 RepID=UPI00260935C2|nr:TraB/GumN family protein [Pelagibius sp.]